MNVLVYLHSFPPMRYVGGELMTLELLSYLVQRGHRVSVYVGEWDKRIPSTYRGMTVRSAAYLSAHVARQHDVFITHPEVRIAVWQHVRGMPYVAVVHNVNAPTLRSLERYAPELTIVGSEYTRRHLPLVVKKKRVSVCPPPICVSQAPHTKIFNTTVNLSLEKGGRILQQMAAHLPQHKFLGVKGGHGQQILDQPSNVTIQEQTPDMTAVYGKTRVLIFPTRDETYGIVVSEAMQQGIPVLASNIPAVREAGGDAAIYLSPYDGPSWIEALRELDDDTQYKHWAAKSQKRGDMLRQQAAANLASWESLLRDVVR